MGEDYSKERPMMDTIVQDIVDSEAWGWETVNLNSPRQPLVRRFMSHIPFLGKRFDVVAEYIPTESEI